MDNEKEQHINIFDIDMDNIDIKIMRKLPTILGKNCGLDRKTAGLLAIAAYCLIISEMNICLCNESCSDMSHQMLKELIRLISGMLQKEETHD